MPLNSHDVDEIRRCASDIGDAADTLSGEIAGKLRRVCADVQPDFSGDAARSLQTVLEDLATEMRDIGNGLQSLSGELNALAARSQHS